MQTTHHRPGKTSHFPALVLRAAFLLGFPDRNHVNERIHEHQPCLKLRSERTISAEASRNDACKLLKVMRI